MIQRKGIGGHQSHASRTVEWLTPPEIILAIGGWQSIGFDPCAPIEQPYPTARRTFTILNDGLAQEWPEGERGLLNPPYGTGVIEPWLARFADHGCGTLLVFARTETEAIFRYVWDRAHAVLMMRGRIHFHIGEAYSDIRTRKTYLAGDRAPGNAGGPTMLCAYGEHDMEILADCGVAGKFLPLIISRSVLVKAIEDVTWRELVAGALAGNDNPVPVANIVAAISSHPKAQGKPHFREKVRQTLLRGAGRRVGPDQWVAA